MFFIGYFVQAQPSALSPQPSARFLFWIDLDWWGYRPEAGLVFTSKARLCPKFGNDLVLSAVKQGDNKGNQFYGCSAFPKCRFIRP